MVHHCSCRLLTTIPPSSLFSFVPAVFAASPSSSSSSPLIPVRHASVTAFAPPLAPVSRASMPTRNRPMPSLLLSLRRRRPRAHLAGSAGKAAKAAELGPFSTPAVPTIATPVDRDDAPPHADEAKLNKPPTNPVAIAAAIAAATLRANESDVVASGVGNGCRQQERCGDGGWSTFTVVDGHLRLSETLPSGQAFRWRHTGVKAHVPSPTGNADEWVGSIEERLYILRQTTPRPKRATPDPVWYHIVAPTPCPDGDAVLRDYFHADTDFTDMYARFCAVDPGFAKVFEHLDGLRVLRQSPEECLFAFICSANNNVKRIATMVSQLAKLYGTLLGTVDDVDHYSFPSVEEIAKHGDEQTLRDHSFGYRAKYIIPTAQYLAQRAENEGTTVHDMLLSWRTLSRTKVAHTLTQYPGVGRKVAGCVALMALDQFGEIPVDTHVWQIARRYMPELQTKSLTMRVYEDVGQWFRDRFGQEDAGIAHNFLFVAELPDFKKLIPPDVQQGKGVVEKDGVGDGVGPAGKKGKPAKAKSRGVSKGKTGVKRRSKKST